MSLKRPCWASLPRKNSMPPSPAHVVPYSLTGTSRCRAPNSATASDGSIILTFRFFSSLASALMNSKTPESRRWCSPKVSTSQPTAPPRGTGRRGGSRRSGGGGEQNTQAHGGGGGGGQGVGEGGAVRGTRG